MFKLKIILISIISILLFGTLLYAESNEEKIELANKEYSNGNYDQAIEAYKSVLETGYESPELYYNIANSYYKSNRLAYAILYYERAKLLAPNDEDIIFNLSLANSHITDKINVISPMLIKTWYNSASSFLPGDTWSVISIASFVLLLILFSVFLYSHKATIRRLTFYLSILSLLITFLSFSFAGHEAKLQTEHNSAIIFNSITVKSSPDNYGTDLFLLHEGTKVTVLQNENDWMKIKLSDGNEGWVKNESLQII